MIPVRPVRTVDVSFAVDSDAAMRLAAARVRVDAIDESGDDMDTARAELDAAQAAYDEAGEVTFRACSVGLVRWSEVLSIGDGVERLRAQLSACAVFVDSDGVEHGLDDEDLDRLLGGEWSDTEVTQILAACSAVNRVSAVVEKKG